jgi:hypothetical protein
MLREALREGSRRSAFEHAGNGLMPAVPLVYFLAIEPQGFEHRGILDGEQDRLPLCFVGVLMPGPRRDDKEISLAPVEALSRDDAEALPREDVVHGAARLAVRLRAHTGPK